MSQTEYVLLPKEDENAAERALFHEWCGKAGIDTDLWFRSQPWCGYSNMRTQDIWQGWLERSRVGSSSLVLEREEAGGETSGSVHLAVPTKGPESLGGSVE